MTVSRSGPIRELWYALAVSWLFVIARSLVYLLNEQAFFDSDRAIIGLMAKHLAEGRAFPLFFYGQTYMLGIEAWFAAPFFLVAGASVATLHASQVALNLIATTLMIVGLTRWGGLRPAAAAVAVAAFTMVPPLTSAYLLESGSNVPPFIFVALLWLVRDRALWFGSLLAVGFLTREFTIYAVPILVLGEAVSGRLWQAERLRHWLIAATVAVATWQGVQVLKPYADLMGPGTRGDLLNGLGGSQIGNLGERMRLPFSDLSERLHGMFTVHLPRLLGGAHVEHDIATQGRDGLFLLCAVGLSVTVARAAWRARRIGFASTAYGWYLFGVGVMAVVASLLTRPDAAVADRYFLLALLLPVGAVAVSLALELSRAWRAVPIVLLAIWATSSVVDHVNHARRYASGQEPNDIRELIDGLAARGITVAEAPYWRAYKTTFMAQERVKVASNDFIRIREYRHLADAQGDALVRIQDTPCRAGAERDRVGIWFLCRP